MKRLLCIVLTGLLLTVPALAAEAAFSDTAGVPQRDQIAYVQERGLFRGTGEGQFSPDQPLTRGQAAAVLARQAQVGGELAEGLSDVPEGAYYAGALGWIRENGLWEAAAGNAFAPAQAVTHGELAGLLNRYLGWLGREGNAEPMGTGTVSRAQAAAYFAELERRLTERDTAVLTHTASDGVGLAGKLDLPAGTGPVDTLVFFVNGSGPNTYDNRREAAGVRFDYFDLFARQFGMRGAGFFRTNTRGVTAGDQPPLFAEIDEADYRTYLPGTSVSDIGEWIGELRKRERLKDADIWLLGWSEGTMIAPLAARQFPGEIAGLLLAGYANDRMDEVFDWQQSGGASMVFYRQYFDADGDGRISPAEYAADPYGLVPTMLGGAAFGDIDLDGDGALSAADFALMLAPGRKAFYDAVDRGDDAWLAENYDVRLTSGWFRAHRALAPNRETLPTLDLPIRIFHGTMDANCSVEGVRAIQRRFAALGKDNLAVRIYEGYDHDLLYSLYVLYGAMPQAFVDLFQSMAE